MILDLKKNAHKLFTQVFYKIRAALKMTIRFIVCYGGAGSSKSVSQHQSELINLIRGCDYDILFMRKVAADIYDSSYKLFESLATEWGIYDWFEWTYSGNKRQILYKKTGRRILFRGADDIGKLKSIVGIGRIVLEEADQFEFADFREINRRARGFKNIQIVFLLNPVDENHWIKKFFVDQPDGKRDKDTSVPIGVYASRTHVIVSTYHDNQFLDDEYIAELESSKEVDENEYNIYVLAKWGRLKTGAEYYPQFKETDHVGKFPFTPSLPVHLTYDFNVVPYMTQLAVQYIEEPEVIRIRVFREYCYKSPLNTSTAVCESFIDDYEKYLYYLFYYGDASGNSRIAGKGDEVNYDDVRAALARYIDDSSNRTIGYNKPVLKRRKIVMRLLAGKLYLGNKKVILEIDESCENTINDFKYLKLGKDGKLKEEVEDKKTKQKYQKHGHCTDAFEYLFCQLFEDLM
jgi:phage terminase large subunit